MLRTIMSALAALALVLVGSSLPANAHHNVPGIDVDTSADCGEVTLTTAWAEPEKHLVDNARLVVLVDGEQLKAPIGESITVGPFESETTTIQYRVWGGGERSYDTPMLDDLDALLAYLDAGDDHSPLDVDAPGLAWETLDVEGCPPVDVEPEEPTSSGETCTDSGDITPATITVPDVEGVSYSITHEGETEDVEPGTSDVTPGEYVIAASADDGYALTGDVNEWKLTIVEAECDKSTPSPEPTDGADEKTSTLPNTGMSHAALAGLALALITAGGVLAFMGRQRVMRRR